MSDDDTEMIADFAAMLMTLKAHPDKAIINALTMIASDEAEAFPVLYKVIETMMFDKGVVGSYKIPLFYLVDSMLNNCEGEEYKAAIQPTIVAVFKHLYGVVKVGERGKLKKVLGLWSERKMFGEEIIGQLQMLFGDGYSIGVLPREVVLKMRELLREMGEGMGETVTLEGLIKDNVSLVKQVEEEARAQLKREKNDGEDIAPGIPPPPPPPDVSPWITSSAPKVPASDMTSLIASLDASIVESFGEVNTDATVYSALLAASATAQFLKGLVEGGDEPRDTSAGVAQADSSYVIDPKDFTNEGLKKKHGTSIYNLYNAMPFVNKQDGRRFRSQEELQGHMGAEFKRQEEEKAKVFEVVSKWFKSESDWVAGKESMADAPETTGMEDSVAESDEVDADEGRPSCGICGKNFASSYSDDKGGYVYTGVREFVVEEENGMESDEVLLHVKCCEKLGICKGGVVFRTQLL